MPETKKKQSGGVQELINEVREIRAAVESIEIQLDDLKPKKGLSLTASTFFQGLIRGFAFAVGATVIAGLLFFVIYNFFQSDVAQEWLSDNIQTAIQNTIGNAVSEGIGGAIGL
ncbi:MAG: hypothetical protein ABH826_04735 [Patescibacteria group bacterium]